MFDVDWGQLFSPTKSIAEIVLRGTFIYLVLFAVMRFLPRRTIGSMGASDILVIVLISETVSNALQGGAESVTEGFILAATVLAWATLVDFLDYKFPHLHIAGGKPLELIRDGELLRDNMAREQVTEDEVMSQLRLHGLDSARDVAKAYIESDGHVSVIVRSRKPMKPPSGRGP